MPYVVLALMLAACSPESPQTVVDGHDSHSADVAIYADAVANPARSDADRERDAGRKPAQVLEFMRIEPGMTILDMFQAAAITAKYSRMWLERTALSCPIPTRRI